jgi:hypothetical protein
MPISPGIRPLATPLYLSPGSIRPPPAGAPRIPPKPSSAPPPRIVTNIGLNEQPIAAASTPVDPAQELADALSSALQGGSGHNVGAVAGQATSRLHHHAHRDDPLQFRRTIIPICMTLGAILIGAGVLLLFSGEDNALPELFPIWAPILFFALAGLCLVIGAANVVSVRHALKKTRASV